MGKFINKNTVAALLIGGGIGTLITNEIWYRIANKLNDYWYHFVQDHVRTLTELYEKYVCKPEDKPSATETVEKPEVEA